MNNNNQFIKKAAYTGFGSKNIFEGKPVINSNICSKNVKL